MLTGHGARIDTTSPGGRPVFGIFAALAEFERELIIERTKAGMAAACARGRNGGRPYKMTPSKLRLAVASMNQPETRIGDLCAELGITLADSVDPTDAPGNNQAQPGANVLRRAVVDSAGLTRDRVASPSLQRVPANAESQTIEASCRER